MILRLKYGKGARLIVFIVMLMHTGCKPGDHHTGTDLAGDPVPNVVTGAIRWDAWIGSSDNVGDAVERILAPERWHQRLPFFAVFDSSGRPVIDGTDQEIMDAEIKYASGALDYWAFLFYSSEMRQALELYLSSEIRGRVNFCLIIEGRRLVTEWDQFYDVLDRSFEEPSYQKVLGDRPLVYLFRPINAINSGAGDWKALEQKMALIRRLASAKGMGVPYFVVMDYSLERLDAAMSNLPADAVSCYAVSARSEGESYETLSKRTEGLWEYYTRTGYRLVPFVTAGWDNRPRHGVAVPWDTSSYQPYWARQATPGGLTAHLQQSYEWIGQHPGLAPARTVIIYAWNEHDEGGWLCPTLDQDLRINDERVRALRNLRKNHNQEKRTD